MKRGNYPELVSAARAAAKFAYAPYSSFAVGAAVLTAGGDIVPGCNIENAAYGPTVCAERVAVFSARARGATRIEAVAIVNRSGTPCYPCGTCRQVLWELARHADIVVEDGKGGVTTLKVSDLLPLPFGPEDLGLPTPGS